MSIKCIYTIYGTSHVYICAVGYTPYNMYAENISKPTLTQTVLTIFDI